MRIGISTSVIQRGKTGVAQYLFALLKALQPFTTQHRFVLFVLEDDLPLFEFTDETMQIVPVPERFRPPVKNILWHQTRLPALARQLGLDVLHVPSYRRLLWRKPCGIVGTIHDLAPFHVSNKYDWKRMFYGRVVARRLAHRQDEIIAISENTAQDIQRFFGLPRENLTVIHNGLDHERFHPANRADSKTLIQQKRGLAQSFFLYVARLEHPGKNHVRLISAFNAFKQRTGSAWQLVFGGSDWHGSEAIHDAIRQSPFAFDIRSLGFVPNEELPDLYRAADALVYPSLYEGFGMPPTEAMACGCPVICSTRGSLGEVVGNAAAIVDPEDVDSIAAQLAAIANDSALRERLRAAGLEQARKFNWSSTGAATLKVYERAAARVTSASAAKHSPSLKLENDSKPALR
jgi:glycosyltransferase involved in cell wall biosynthesis